MAFEQFECDGDRTPVERTTEFIKKDGIDFYATSFAYIKEAKPGCVNFYTDYCHKGNPSFSICNDIADSQMVNLNNMSKVQGLLADSLSIKRISFYDQPNFQGNAYTIDATPIYNAESGNNEFYNRLAYGKTVRSVKLHKN